MKKVKNINVITPIIKSPQIKKNADAAEILNFISEYKQVPLTRKMHRTIREAGYIQQIQYLDLVGLQPEIARQEQFQDAVNLYKFQTRLNHIGVKNCFAKDVLQSKRIVAVHPTYVQVDEEVIEGLKTMPLKHQEDNTVFVESDVSLEYAIENCLPDATLVIDGHWMHNKKCMHGVWDLVNAEEIATKITNIINNNPGKIIHINLLGCEAGVLRKDVDPNILENKQLFFKYDKNQRPLSANRECADMRNRAIFISENNQSLFDPESFAYQVLSKLEDKSIAVTATQSLVYPYPVKNPRFNIASDASNWKAENHYWRDPDARLNNLKSITQVDSRFVVGHPKRPWSLRP